jgi:signal transduction histidine kinase
VPRWLRLVLADLAADVDHERVLSRTCRAYVELTGAGAACVLVLDGDRARLTAEVGFPPAAVALDHTVRAAIIRRLVAGGRRHVIGDHRSIGTISAPLREALAHLPAAVLTGLFTRGQLVGVLVGLHTDVGHRLDDDEARLVDVLASAAAVAEAIRRRDDEMVRAEVRHATIIDGIADGLAVLDDFGLVTVWNAAAAELTGLPAVQAIGRPFPLPLPDPGRPVEHDLGEGRWVEVVRSGLREGAVVAIHDLSRQKALDAAKTMFVAATSHELKTPLTVIKSFADWLASNADTAEADRRRMAVDAIADSAEELRQLVEKVLLTARTEAGAIDLDLQTVEPTRLVRAVASLFAVAGDGHHLRIELADDLPLVRADPQAVRTALGQLLENAFKYSPDGGVVTVSARPLPDGSAVEIAVADEGIGLAPGEIEYLFLAFYQGETRSRSRVRGGVGLGLSIVRRLVEAMGGHVGAEGQPGQGSRFWLTLPVDDGDDDLRPTDLA